MKLHNTLNRLDDLIRTRSILQHPFYVAWQRGELTRPQLAGYATVYYPHVAAFPGYLKNAIGCSDEPAVREELQRNLVDEISHPKPHNELWLDFGEEFGLLRTELENTLAHPAAQKITSVFNGLTELNAGSALAALYAYESQQPEVSRQKSDGLRQFYGVKNPNSLAYFEVHAEADIEHRSGERHALSLCLAAGASPEAIMKSARDALDAYWGLLDGICEEAGIAVANCQISVHQ